MELWYNISADDALEKLGSDRKGLSLEEAAQRLQKYGRNEIKEKSVSKLSLFLEQFKSFLVLILVFAAILAFVLGEAIEALVISMFIFLNTGMGFYQENRAFDAVKALKKMIISKVDVIRSSKPNLIDASELVPGDIINLKEGEKVPADCRIISCSSLKADESVLTGESVPMEKNEETIFNVVPISERSNMLFSGTTVVHGHCKCLVVSTGMSTEFGSISKMLDEKEEQTPLQKHLDLMGKDLTIILVILCASVFGMGIFLGMGIVEMLLVALALAVAVLPSSLPAVTTLTMAIGVQRMAKRSAIMRKLSAVETLGSTTVICTDKTGTLTVNEMTVKKLHAGDMIIDVSGDGFSQQGEFFFDGEKITIDKHEDAKELLTAGMLCNDSRIDGSMHGDPTEIALLIASRKAEIGDLREIYPRTEEVPFDYKKRTMATVFDISGTRVAYAKGAFEEILGMSTHIMRNGKPESLKKEERDNLHAINCEFSTRALRVIAVATKKLIRDEILDENGFTFLGFFGMIDPPRREAKESIDKCKQAGIKVVMITGDHKNTAARIAIDLGIIENSEEAIEASQIDNLSEEEFLKNIDNIGVYARATPEHKVRITEALKKKGHIVAMTGDGVNDAPALNKADIGIAMGKNGTDVAKETASMVLSDDNFATIVSAVEEGRGIYDNIKKVIYFLISCNFAEVLTLFIATLIIAVTSSPMLLPLLPLQLLWMNLLTDGLPAIALGLEPLEKNIMERKPRNPNEKILGMKSIGYILFMSAIMTASTLVIFYTSMPGGYAYATTMAFTSLVMFEMVMVLGVRIGSIFSTKTSRTLALAILSSVALQLAVVYIPYLNPIFGTTPIGLIDWAMILGISALLLIVIEIHKAVREGDE